MKALRIVLLFSLLAASMQADEVFADNPSSQKEGIASAAGAQLLWDYRGVSRSKAPVRLFPLAGAVLPDGSIILTALWNEGAGDYWAYKISNDGQLAWRYRIFEDPIDGIEAWPGLIPLLRPRPGGAYTYGYIATGRLIGPRYFTDEGGQLPPPEWRAPPPEPFTAFASSTEGRATVGGAEAETSNPSPLAPCSRALVVQLDSNGRETWRWRFRPEHRATYVRSLQYLDRGSTLVFIDDRGLYGSWIDGCTGQGTRRWLVWVDPDGRDYRTVLVTHDAQWAVALDDGRIVTLGSEDWREANWEINWYTYAADGSKLISTKEIDLTTVDSTVHGDVPQIKGVWSGHGRLYLSIQWSAFEVKREYQTRLAVFTEDSKLLGLSAPFDWHSLILGPTADQSAFIVAAPDGLYRVPMP